MKNADRYAWAALVTVLMGACTADSFDQPSGLPPKTPEPGMAVREIAYVACYGAIANGCSNAGISFIHDDGSNEHTVGDVMNDYAPAWSPDGSRLAFASKRDCIADIPACPPILYAMPPYGRSWQELSNLALFVNDPCAAQQYTDCAFPGDWSPDGRRLAFIGGEGSAHGLYVVDTNGSNQEVQIAAGNVFAPSWSPDGSLIAYIEDSSPQAQLDRYENGILVIADANGPRRVRLPAYPRSGKLDWSPDGQKIAYETVTAAPRADCPNCTRAFVHVIGADGTDDHLLHEGSGGRWSPDGRKVALTWHNGVHNSVLVIDEAGGVRTIARGSNPEWSPDGSRVAYRIDYGIPGFGSANADGTNARSARPGARIGSAGVAWSPVPPKPAPPLPGTRRQ